MPPLDAANDLEPIYQAAAQANGIDPDLLHAQTQVESSDNDYAVSPQGAQGRSQFIPSTARAMGINDPTDPREAIPAQAKLMRENMDKFGDPAMAIRAYHGGTDTNQWGPKTEDYLRKVADAYGQRKQRAQANLSFDDLVPQQEKQAAPNLSFDDLIPQGTPLTSKQAVSQLPMAQTDEGSDRPFPLPSTPQDTGWIDAAYQGLMSSVRGGKQTYQALTGANPGQASQPTTAAAEPIAWGDVTNPGLLGRKVLYGLAATAPEIAGFTAGAAVAGGPETPVGMVAGGVGAAIAHAATSLGPAFGEELKKTPDNPDAAFNSALKQTGVGSAFSAIGFGAFGVAPFEGALKNLVFQAFGVQPAVAVGEKAASNVAGGQPATEGLMEGVPGAVLGTAAPMLAHAGASALGRRLGAGAGEAPSIGPEAPPGAAPDQVARQEPAATPAGGANFENRALEELDPEVEEAATAKGHSDLVHAAAEEGVTIPPRQKSMTQAEREAVMNPPGRPAEVAGVAAAPEPNASPPLAAPVGQPSATHSPATVTSPITSAQVQARDGVGGVEARRRADAENAAAAASPESTPESTPAEAPRIRTLQQIQDEDGVGAKKAQAIQMEEIAARGRPVTQEEVDARKAGIAAPAAEPPPTAAEPEALPDYMDVPKETERLASFIRRQGGVQDPGGDLRSSMGGVRGRPGLLNNKSGMSINDAMQLAWEAGYFPEFGAEAPRDEHLLLEKLHDDLNNYPVYSHHDDLAVAQRELAIEHNNQIERMKLSQEAAAPDEDEVPWGARKAPLPPRTGTDLFGVTKEPPAKREPEPTIKSDARQIDMFGTADAAVQAQAAADQAGRGGLNPAVPQQKADQGLFAPPEPDQGAMFARGAQEGPAPHPEAVQSAVDVVDKMLGGKARIEAYGDAPGGFVLKYPDRDVPVRAYTLGSLIRIATGDNTEHYLNHEALHAMRNFGVFKPNEWATLERAAEKEGWADRPIKGEAGVEPHPIREIYKDLKPDQITEEAIAERFANYMGGERPESPFMQRMWNKVQDFFARLKNSLAGRGFQTADDVFGRMASGEIGAREQGSGMRTRGPMSPNAAVQKAARFDPGMRAARAPQPPAPAYDVLKDKTGLDRVMSEVKAGLAPSSLKGAKPQERQLRRHVGESAQSYDIAFHKLEAVRQAVDKLPTQLQDDFTHRMETGQKQTTPQLQAVADTLRSILDEWAGKIQSLGKGYLANAIDDYMGHIWGNYREWAAGLPSNRTQAQMQQGATAGNVAKSPLRGPGHFLKQRHFPTQQEGMAMGLEPVTHNPVDLQLIKIHELQKMYHGTQLADRMKTEGIASFVSEPEQRMAEQRGLVKLDDRVFQPKLYGASPIGPVDPGAYYAPEPMARLFNNYMSKGWHGQSAIYDGIRRMNNALNTLQLGASGFHATFVSVDTAISKVALGLNQIAEGQFGRGVGNLLFGTAGAPGAVVSTVRRGAAVRRAWLDPQNATPEMQKVLDMMKAGGTRISMPEFFQTSSSGSFFRTFNDLRNPASIWHDSLQMVHDAPTPFQKAVMTPIRIAGRLLDTINQPLMGALVPRAKLGVMADLTENFLRQHPNATPAQISDAAIKFQDTVDNRLGQLNYDNLYWNKVAKDLAFITTRSVGWNLGTLREIGGGLVDTVGALNAMAHGKAPQLTTRMAYTLALPIVTAQVGALMTYFATNAAPTSMLDYFYPPTGGQDDSGQIDRRSIPGYMKDVIAAWHDPIQTALNKTSPMIDAVHELRSNRTYSGGIIYDPQRDSGPLQAYGDYILNEATPFSFRSWSRQSTEGASALDQSMGFWGFQPAPASIAHPEKGERYERQQMKRAYINREKQVQKGNYIRFLNHGVPASP